MAGATQLGSFDIWWHLKTGEIIALIEYVPTFDPFSWTVTGASWVNHEWLFQVFAWHIYSLFEIHGLIIVRFIIFCALVYIFYRLIKDITHSTIASMCAMIILIFSIAHRVMMRPFFFTFLFVVSFLYLLHRYQQNKKAWLWLMPIITIPWINLHAGGLLSIAILGAFSAGETIDTLISQWRTGITPLAKSKLYYLWLLTLLCILACTLTPYGIRTLLFPFEHFDMENILKFTSEWIPISDARVSKTLATNLYEFLSYLLPLLYLINLKKLRISHLFLTIVSIYLVYQGSRFTCHFMFINLPLAFYYSHPLGRYLGQYTQFKGCRQWIYLTLFTLISFFCIRYGVISTITGHTAGELGIREADSFIAPKAVSFLDRNHIYGKNLNSMAMGGYLIYSRWPREKVFIDGRTPIYGDLFFKKWMYSSTRIDYFSKLDQEYQFDYLIFPAHSVWGNRPLHYYLWKLPHWILVYAGQDAFIYLRDIPNFNEQISKLKIIHNPLIKYMIQHGEVNASELPAMTNKD